MSPSIGGRGGGHGPVITDVNATTSTSPVETTAVETSVPAGTDENTGWSPAGIVGVAAFVGLLGAQILALSGWWNTLVKFLFVPHYWGDRSGTIISALAGVEVPVFRGTASEISVIVPTATPILLAAVMTAIIVQMFDGSKGLRVIGWSMFVFFYTAQFFTLTLLHWNTAGL